MSISEIVNYVNRTPHNTNPSVIASMVQGANEQAVYESVEKLKQNGGVGYTEPAKVILDVDLQREEGSASTGTQFTEIPTSITLIEGQAYTVRLDSGTYTDVCKLIEMNGEIAYYIGNPSVFGQTGSDLPFVVVSAPVDFGNGVGMGITVLDKDGGTHVTIAKAETVHTIDPKYLPNNVINIQDHGFESLLTYLTMAMTGGNGHIADVEVHDFWEKVDDIQQDGCNFIWLTDNEGNCLCMIPTAVGKTVNLSNVQWISFVPDVDAYVNAKVNFNRGSYGYDVVRLSVWLDILPKT